MKSSAIVTAWAAVCAAFVFIHAGAASAQVIDGDACTAACQDQHDTCVESCSDGNDPVDCDDNCQDALDDCVDACPDD